MLQGSVALRVDGLEREAHRREAAAFDPGALRRNAHPREALADQVTVREVPVWRSVEATRDVEPLDDDTAVEARRSARSAHHDARAVGRLLGAQV